MSIHYSKLTVADFVEMKLWYRKGKTMRKNLKSFSLLQR